MALLNLSRFRDLAFRRSLAPDHPIENETAARELLESLEGRDPAAALAEITATAASMSETDSFTPGRRARVLMVLDDAARAYWHALGEEFLSPGGHPSEGRDGDRTILRALFESAEAFANCYALALLPAEKDSSWVAGNYAQVALRNMRWLARRLTLANMLHIGDVDTIWGAVHRLYREAEERKGARTVLPVFPDHPFPSSVKQEYARLLMIEIASPGSLRGREVELAFRIAGRVAAAAKLEPQALPGAVFGVVPAGKQRPQLASKLAGAKHALWLDTTNCLPRLRAALERDAGRDGSEVDTLYGGNFTLRERNSMLQRLMDAWGPNPPQRRTQRVRLASTARVVAGFEAIAQVTPLVDQGPWTGGGRDPSGELRLQLDDVEEAAARMKASASRQNPAKLLDASATGMGLSIPRKDAKWATLGTLVAACIDPGHQWSVGVLRRLVPEGNELRLGIQVLSRHPRLVWFKLQTVRRETPWDEALHGQGSFLDHFQRGILLSHGAQLEAGDMLVEPHVVSRGSQLDIPLATGVQRVRITTVRDTAAGFQRVAFELLKLASYAKRKKSPGPDDTWHAFDDW
jgi:hypothetical protein